MCVDGAQGGSEQGQIMLASLTGSSVLYQGLDPETAVCRYLRALNEIINIVSRIIII